MLYTDNFLDICSFDGLVGQDLICDYLVLLLTCTLLTIVSALMADLMDGALGTRDDRNTLGALKSSDKVAGVGRVG